MRKFTFIKSLFLAVALLAGNAVWGQVNITPTRTAVSGFTTWTDVSVEGTDYIQLLTATSSTTTPAMNFNNYTNETLNFKARTFGGTNTVENEVFIAISTNNGDTWTDIGSRTPTTKSLVAMSSFDLSAYAGTQVKIKFYAKGTNNSIGVGIDDITITGIEGISNAVSTPTFTPIAGNYLGTQNVSISTATEGATIRYTTNGDEPTETSTEYTTPISVSSTTTIKAKAFKTGMDASSVASATYTFPVEVANIGALRSQTTGTTVYKLTGEAILTLKSANRNVKYIQDATGGILIDDNNGLITTTYNTGDGITGIVGTINLFNGMLQLTPVADPGAATSSNNTVTPVEITLNNLSNYPGQLVKIKNLTVAGTGNFAASTSYNISDGTNTAVIRTQYTDLPYIASAIPEGLQDITGVVLMYNTTAQLIPRTINDFSTSVVVNPTITVTELTVPEMTAVTGLTDTETVNVSGAALTADILVTIDGADAAMFSVLPASIAQTAGEASGAVTVTYSPTAPGTHTATLKFNSTGATEVTRILTGTSTMATPVAIDGSGVSQTGFTANWNAVAGATEYELNVYTKTTGSATTILSENFDGFSAGTANASANSTDVSASLNTYTQTSGWTGNKVYQAGGTAKMGGGSALGYITTPAIDLSGADITLDFKAMAWSGDATELKVFLDNNLIYTATGLNNTDYTLSPYSTTITGGTANSKIRFEAKQTSSARFFIDDVVIAGKPSTSTPIAGSPFTVTGETSKAISGLTAGTTYYYTVVAKNGSVATAVSNEVAVTTSTGTGLSNTVKNMNLRAVNGNIVLNAEAGQLVEVYNSIGQKVGSRLTSEGVNTIPARVKGVVFVKIGSEVSKLIME